MATEVRPCLPGVQRSPSARGRQVLFVSSNEVSRAVEAQAVSQGGDECVAVSSLAEASQSIESGRAGLLLVDAAVAAGEGARACAGVRSTGMPLVLLTELGSPASLLESCWRAGFDDCVLRPLRMAQVQARLDALETPQARPVRDLTRTIVLYADASPYQACLRRLLERNGHRVLLRQVSGGLHLDWGETVDCLVVRSERTLMPALLEGARSEPALARTPALLLGAGSPERRLQDPRAVWLDETRLDLVLQRANEFLGCGTQCLRAEEAVPFYAPVEFRERGSTYPGPWATGMAYELSPGGLFVQTLLPLRPRVATELRIHLTGVREEVTATGVIAWAHRWGSGQRAGMAVQLLGVPESKSLGLLLSASVEPG